MIFHESYFSPNSIYSGLSLYFCLTVEISTATTKPPHGPTPSTSAAGPVFKTQSWPTSMFTAKELLLQAPPPFPDRDPPATTGPSTA